MSFQAEDAEGDLEDEDDDDEMLLPPRRRAHDQDEDEEEREHRRSSHPAQSSVLYQDLLMSDGEDDASEEEGDNPFSCESSFSAETGPMSPPILLWFEFKNCRHFASVQPFSCQRVAATPTERSTCDRRLHGELRRRPAWAWSRTRA